MNLIHLNDIYEIRRRNLRKWIDEKFDGIQVKFINFTEINQGELSGLLKNRAFGEKKARQIEEKSGMPPMWLDKEHENQTIENSYPLIELSNRELRSIQKINKIKEIINKDFSGSQTAFAKAIKKSNVQVNQWITGKRNIGNNLSSDIERALNLPIGFLDDIPQPTIAPIFNGAVKNSEVNTASIIIEHNKHNNLESVKNSDHMQATPLLGIDEGVHYVVTHGKTKPFEIKLSIDDLKENEQIKQNDILTINPEIPPRDKDLVLICLNYQEISQRGMVAKLFVNLQGEYKIKYSEQAPEMLPKNALICGVVTKIKRQALTQDLINSRTDPKWNIFNTLQG